MVVKIGLKGVSEAVVKEDMTARSLRSGGQDVLATPIMIALMEEAALLSLRPCLAAGEDSVGTRIDVRHLSATPVGMKVRVESEVTEVDRRRVVFAVRAFDEAGLIGEGTHERFVVDGAKFMEKCRAKKAARA